jgi:hypothetical protein
MHEAGSFVDCCWFDDYIISPEPAFLFAISIGYSLSKCHSGLSLIFFGRWLGSGSMDILPDACAGWREPD